MALDYGGFYETFARFYDHFRPVRDGEIAFYREQATLCGGPVLELGCGTGQVLMPLAASGIEVWGMDASPAMLAVLAERLARARAESPGTAMQVSLLRGDMREFALPRLFGAVIIPYHTFQHLLSPADQRGCLECARRHLADGGRLVLDIAGFDPSRLRRGRGAVRVERQERIRDPDVPGELETTLVVELDPATGRALQTRSLRRGRDELLRASTEIRYLGRDELGELLRAAGFRVLRRMGGFRGEPFSPGGEQVWVAGLQGHVS